MTKSDPPQKIKKICACEMRVPVQPTSPGAAAPPMDRPAPQRHERAPPGITIPSTKTTHTRAWRLLAALVHKRCKLEHKKKNAGPICDHFRGHMGQTTVVILPYMDVFDPPHTQGGHMRKIAVVILPYVDPFVPPHTQGGHKMKFAVAILPYMDPFVQPHTQGGHMGQTTILILRYMHPFVPPHTQGGHMKQTTILILRYVDPFVQPHTQGGHMKQTTIIY